MASTGTRHGDGIDRRGTTESIRYADGDCACSRHRDRMCRPRGSGSRRRWVADLPCARGCCGGDRVARRRYVDKECRRLRGAHHRRLGGPRVPRLAHRRRRVGRAFQGRARREAKRITTPATPTVSAARPSLGCRRGAQDLPQAHGGGARGARGAHSTPLRSERLGREKPIPSSSAR